MGEDWRALYAALQQHLREMKSRLTDAETEARIYRERAARHRQTLQKIRAERRATARTADPADLNTYRRRRKKR